MRAISLALLLTGCASLGSAPGIQPIKTVNKSVAVSCVKDAPTAPKLHTDAEIKAMGDYEAVLTLFDDRIKQAIYTMLLEAVVEGCK